MEEETVREFITEFHNLEGVTVAEKRRNLFKLLGKNENLSQNQPLLNLVKSQLKPQTHLENIFIAEFLIYYRQFNDLYNEFLKGNEIIVSKIAKENWFFQHAFKEIGPEFVTQTLPTLSYRLRLKILKKMVPVLSEQQADVVFDALLKRYGIFMAANILTSCSSDKITEVLKKHAVRLWSYQLKMLYHKNPKLIYTYLEERMKHEGNKNFMDSEPIFEYIAERDIEMYCDLFNKYDFNAKLGKRVTKKFVEAKRSEIIDKPELYVKNLNPARLVRKLGVDFKQVYFKLFPRSIKDSPNAQSSRLLKFYAKNGQYNLMVSTFNQIFTKKLEECPHLIDHYVLTMITDANERERMAKIKSGNGESHTKYYKTEHSIPFFKEKIKFEREPWQRTRWVIRMVQSCLINGDYNALLELSKFSSERFKNDNKATLTEFLNTLVQQGCNFDKFNDGHWEEIKKIFAATGVQKYADHAYKTIFYRYIEFLSKNNRPMDDAILQFFGKRGFVVEDMMGHMRDAQAAKLFLCNFIELAPQVTKTIEKLDCQLILACKNYNSRHPKNIIRVWEYPRLTQSLILACKSYNSRDSKNTTPALFSFHSFMPFVAAYQNSSSGLDVDLVQIRSALMYMACSNTRSDAIEELTEIYCKNFAKFGTQTAVKWFLQNKPQLISVHFQEFISFCTTNEEMKKDKKTWRLIKCYNHLDIDKKSIDYCISKMNDPNEKNPHLMIRPISLLMSPEEYLKFAESYKPTSFTIDRGDEEMNRKFLIQKNILKGLVNFTSIVNTITLILEYCKKDYVPATLSSLYSAFYNIPENEISPFIDELLGKDGISIKKHGFYLSCVLSDQEKVINILQNCKLPQSVTITFKYFLKNSSEQTWSLFKEKLSSFDRKHHTILKALINKLVPRKFRSRHFETMWTIINSQKSDYKKLMLQQIQNKTVLDLKQEIITELLNKELFTMDEMYKIASFYLIESQEQEKFNIIFKSLETYKESPQFSRKKLYNFIWTFFTTYMEDKNTNEQQIEAFSTRFQQIFHPSDTLEENVMFAIMNLKNRSIQDISKEVIALNNNLISKYGETIVNIFSTYLTKLLPHLCKCHPEKYEFYHLLLQHKRSVEDMLLVIKLLPTEVSEDKESFIHYDHTLSQLQDVNLDCILLHLALLFKSHKTFTQDKYYTQTNMYALHEASWLQYGAKPLPRSDLFYKIIGIS